MTAIALDRETKEYWDIIKSASSKSKLSLIMLLSASMADEDIVVTHAMPLKAHRRTALSDEQIEDEMKGSPVPIESSDENISELIDANRGRIVEGLEKWL